MSTSKNLWCQIRPLWQRQVADQLLKFLQDLFLSGRTNRRPRPRPQMCLQKRRSNVSAVQDIGAHAHVIHMLHDGRCIPIGRQQHRHVIIIAHPFFLIVDHDTRLVAPVMLKLLSLALKDWGELFVVSSFKLAADAIDL